MEFLSFISRMRILVLILSAFGLVSCTDKSKPNIELIQDMMEQPAVKAQKEEKFFKNGISELVPPENTVPVGFKPYKFKADPEAAGLKNLNPLQGRLDEETLAVGKKFFETNCAVCHGYSGKGDGPISSKYPTKIPALVSDKVRNWKDGSIYHVITMGQGQMGPYASHVPQKYRWQVVNYIRKIQQETK